MPRNKTASFPARLIPARCIEHWDRITNGGATQSQIMARSGNAGNEHERVSGASEHRRRFAPPLSREKTIRSPGGSCGSLCEGGTRSGETSHPPLRTEGRVRCLLATV